METDLGFAAAPGNGERGKRQGRQAYPTRAFQEIRFRSETKSRRQGLRPMNRRAGRERHQQLDQSARRQLKDTLMASGSGPFSVLQAQLLDPYSTFLETAGRSLSAGLRPVIVAAATIYIGMTAVRLLLGGGQLMQDFFKTSMKIVAVSFIALNFDNYMEYVASPMIDGIPNGISQFITGKPAAEVSQFDSAANSLSAFISAYWASTGWSTYKMAIAAVWIIQQADQTLKRAVKRIGGLDGACCQWSDGLAQWLHETAETT